MAGMMIEVEPELKHLGEAIQALLDRVRRCRAESAGGASVDYGAVEEGIRRDLGCAEVAAHEALLQALDVDAPFIRVWGKEYRRVGRHPGRYYSLGGAVEFERTVYRQLGERNGETVDAVSLRAGAVADGWLPRAARAMAHLMAKGTSREAAETSDELLTLGYSRSSFERVGHAVGRLYDRDRSDVEAFLIKSFDVPEEARSVSISVDRVSLPMEEQDSHPSVNDGKPWPVRKYRMAYCGTVTVHDGEGEALHTIRYGRMPIKHAFLRSNADSLCSWLARDTKAILQRRPDLKVTFLADGGKELWNLADLHFCAMHIGRELDGMLVDFWHATEYLGQASTLMRDRGVAGGDQLDRWKLALLNDDGAAATIVAQLRATGLENVRKDLKKPVGDAIRYIESRYHLMEYAAARRAGLPVGSGAVEATCKSLVALRMKRPGSRWKSRTGDDILNLRALVISDRWKPGMEKTLGRLRKPVKALAHREAA